MMKEFDLLHGDCLEVMRQLDDSSIDSIVTDPPYGLGFMGKEWDRGVPGVEFWKEAIRILKPGGYLLAFGGSRTYHRLAVAVEDAGFEIRDQIMWVYASGFPKSLNLSKAIDRAAGAEREIIGRRQHPTLKDKSKVDRQGRLPNHGGNKFADEWELTVPSTEEAKQWDGWGTALKPAHEPIVMARKPIAEKNIASNVMKHGVGAINIDACRIGNRERTDYGLKNSKRSYNNTYGNPSESADFDSNKGRWPANLIHDGSDCVIDQFPATKSGKDKSDNVKSSNSSGFTGNGMRGEYCNYGDQGSASRFFYCAKASPKDRHQGILDKYIPQFKHGATLRKIENIDNKTGNHHPTVKPTDLMRYLCRLVTPPGSVILDPFMGSGSTGKAALLEGFRFIGIEIDESYLEIANARIQNVLCVNN